MEMSSDFKPGSVLPRVSLWVLGAWLFGAGALLAQPMPAAGPSATKPAPEAGAPADAPASAAAASVCPDCVPACRCWTRVDYLLWWVRNSPLPVPVVTTGDPRIGFDPNGVNTVNTAGAFGQPGTRVVFGGESIQLPPFSGIAAAVGGWFDDQELLGGEVGGFILEHGGKRLVAGSNAAGNPPLYFPISTGVPPQEMGLPIADPLRGFSGGVGLIQTLQLWGAEANAILPLGRRPGVEWTMLAGFRYADLKDRLQIYNTTTDFIFDNVISLNDSFSTRNQFYGGQIGSRLALERNRLSVNLTGKLALGATHQFVDVRGNITQAGPNPLVPPGLGAFPGGVFTQSTNIGRRTADQFSILPSLELRLGCAISERARLVVGYDILYWNRVVRPGDQIDHNVNLTQNAVLDPNGLGILVGPALPAPLFNRSDFWAQGISIGLELVF